MRVPAIGLLALVSAGTACAADAIDERAQAVINRTRETHADYSVFTWNRITPENAAPREEWSAEFNKGNLHRVETPRDRLIADCDAQTGTYFSVETKRVLRGASIAKAACGVQANSKILSASYDGTRTGPFGKTDHITVNDAENVRTYEVAANGAIVGATISSSDGHLELEMIAVALEPTAPEDIYSEESLAESTVPEKYRSPPKRVSPGS